MRTVVGHKTEQRYKRVCPTVQETLLTDSEYGGVYVWFLQPNTSVQTGYNYTNFPGLSERGKEKDRNIVRTRKRPN